MPMPQKPAPEQYCEQCGTRLARKRFNSGVLEDLTSFKRRKFCGRRCMAENFDARPVKDTPSWMTAHWHARKAVPPGPCVICGSPSASDVHHKNEDWQDNTSENLERICRTCHTRAHHKRMPCMLYGKPQKGLGYCAKHYQRFKKYGDPFMCKRNQHSPLVRLDE